MSKLKNFLVYGGLTLCMMFPTSASITSNALYAAPHEQTFVLPQVVITAKKLHKHFLGFQLQKGLDTSVESKLKEALTELRDLGAPNVRISSLKRHKWNPKSKHRCGKAVDFEFSHDLIVWLVGETGSQWRAKYGITFYIESKPHDKTLIPYKENTSTAKYVFENPFATNDHIHLNI